MDGNTDSSKEVAVINDMERPREVVEYGKNAAKVLKDVVTQANLIKNINGKQYMMFEGWQTVGKFFKTNAGIQWTKPVYSGREPYSESDLTGFEARAYVKDEKGNIISTAESYCGKDEPNWKDKPVFAIRSMAQTRACAKALRQVYAWVVVLAGYKSTPLDEMDGIVTKKEIIPPEDPLCTWVDCGVKLSDKVYKFSIETYKAPFCFKHQKEMEKKLTEVDKEVNGESQAKIVDAEVV